MFAGAGMTLNASFSTPEVLEMTGASARQLQWWDERGLVVPQRNHRNRTYSLRDLIDILVILELRRRHISLQQVRRVLRYLRTQLGSRFADLVNDSNEHHLLLDGNSVYLATDSRQIVDLIRNARQPVFLICLSDTVRRLRFEGDRLEQVSPALPRKQAGRVSLINQMKEAG